MASLVAPIIAPVLLCIISLMFDLENGGNVNATVFSIFLFITPISYIAAFIFGLPYYRLLLHYKNLSSVALVSGGCLVGVVAGIAYGFVIPYGIGSVLEWTFLEILNLAAIGAILGGAVSICFIQIARITSTCSRTWLTPGR